MDTSEINRVLSSDLFALPTAAQAAAFRVDPDATIPPKRPPVDFLSATDDGYEGPLYVAEAKHNGATLYLCNGTDWQADVQRADTFSNVHAAQAFVRAALILCPELEEFVTYRRVKFGLVLL